MPRLAGIVLAVIGFMGIAAVVASCAGTIGTTETESDTSPSDKFDASLRSAMATRAEHDTLAILIELDADAEADAEARLDALGFEIDSSAGRIRTGRATVAAIRRIAAEAHVLSIALSQDRQLN